MLLCLCAAELGLRLLVGSPIPERLPISRVQASPYRGWAMVPGEAHFTYLEEVLVDELGLRGRSPGGAAGEERRILALGDSLVYGQGVGEEETLPHHLERVLESAASASGPWRVLNAGHRGYATNQELGLLRELGARIAPEIVLLFWYWNDLEEPDVERIHQRLLRSGPVEFDLNERLEGPRVARWRLKQLARRSALVMWVHDLWRAARAEPTLPEQQEPQLARLDRRLGEFVRDAALLGARPFFVVLPDAGALRGAHPSVALGERALALARARGIPSFDALPAMRERFGARRRLPVLPYDGHYQGEANRALAEDVGRWLLEGGALVGAAAR